MAESPLLVELPGERLYKSECYLQTFTLGDARTLSLIQKTADTTTLYELINKRCSLPVKNLTLQDLWFILHWQRINSYPTYPLRLPWECPNCEHSNNHELSASKLVIDDLNPEYEHGLTVDFPSAGELKIRLPLVGDEEEALKYLRKSGITKPDIGTLKELLIACMLEPNGGNLTERHNIVSNMTAEDDFIVQAFEQEFEYGVKNHAKLECDKCQEVSKVRFNFSLTSFFPSISHAHDLRLRILPSKAPVPTDRESGEHGSRESDIYQGDAHKEPKRTQEQERPSKGKDTIKVEEPTIANYDDFIKNK